jgi:hypothetical protein
LTERFDVADAAILKDKAYIPDISVIWKPGADLFEIASNYLGSLADIRPLEQSQIKMGQSAITKLKNLPDFQSVALTLSSTVDVETIAEVFVRNQRRREKAQSV